MEPALATCDAILEAHRDALGPDYTAYRNHVQRVVRLALSQLPAGGELQKQVEIAGAFHDLGIWTHGTFDYIGPSADFARTYLAAHALDEWEQTVTAMIEWHHGMRPRPQGSPEEVFRRADWTDVTLGLRHWDFPRAEYRALLRRWPDAGFHRRLVQLGLRNLARHPFRPLPMFRW